MRELYSHIFCLDSGLGSPEMLRFLPDQQIDEFFHYVKMHQTIRREFKTCSDMWVEKALQALVLFQRLHGTEEGIQEKTLISTSQIQFNGYFD